MTYVTYKVRWLILFGLFVTALNRQMTVSAIALRNGDVAQYLNSTPYLVDVLSVGDAIVATITCFCLSIIGRHVGVRASCLVVGCFLTFGNLLVSIGFVTRNYYCILSGRLLAGVAVGVTYILPGTFANAWFPSSQIATAFCITFLGFNTGGAIASIVFSIEFPTDIHNASSAGESHSMDDVGSLYSAFFEVSTASLLCATIIFWFFSKDRPPTPPSEAEALLTRTNENKPKFDFKSDLSVAMKLLCNQQFVLLSLGNSFNTTALVILFVLMPSLVVASFPQVGISKTISYINLASFIGATCIAFASGRVLDKTRWYKGITCGGSLLAAMFGIGVALGHHYKSLITVCIFYPLMFVFRIATITPFVEFLVETTYPVNKTVLVSLHFTFYNAAYFVMSSVERVAFHSGGPTTAAIIPIIGNVLGCIFAFLVKPEYRRTKANETETTSTK